MNENRRISRQRLRRKRRVRRRIRGDAERPRLSVSRSHKHIGVQIIDDVDGRTLASASTQEKEVARKIKYGGNQDAATEIGRIIAERASKITGENTLFLRGMTGPYGGIGWLTGYDTIADMEKAQDALAADPSWVQFLDTTEGAFVEDPGVTVSTLYRKLA